MSDLGLVLARLRHFLYPYSLSLSKSNNDLNHLKTVNYDIFRFINYDFSNSDLTIIKFMELEFESCILNMAKLTKKTL